MVVVVKHTQFYFLGVNTEVAKHADYIWNLAGALLRIPSTDEMNFEWLSTRQKNALTTHVPNLFSRDPLEFIISVVAEET